jgi:hypothetical protein
MPQDIFDRVQPDDIFDKIAPQIATQGDVFDRVGGDIFDRVEEAQPDFTLGGEIPSDYKSVTPSYSREDIPIVPVGWVQSDSKKRSKTDELTDDPAKYFRNLYLSGDDESPGARRRYEEAYAREMEAWEEADIREESKEEGFIQNVLGDYFAGGKDIEPRSLGPDEDVSLGSALKGKGTPIKLDEILTALNIIPRTAKRLVKGTAKYSFDAPGAVSTHKDLIFDIGVEALILGGLSTLKKFMAGSGLNKVNAQKVVDELRFQLLDTDKLPSRTPFKEVPTEAFIEPVKKKDLTPLIKGLREGGQATPPTVVKPLDEDAMRELQRISEKTNTVFTPDELMPELRPPTHTGARRAGDDTLSKLGDKAKQKELGNRIYDDAALPQLETSHPQPVRGKFRMALDNVTPMDNVLHAQGQEAIVEPIWAAASKVGRFNVTYNGTREAILHGIKPGSPAAKAIPGLLENRVLLDDVARKIGPVAAAKAGQAAIRLRKEFFEPIIDILQDKTLRDVLGTVDYVNAYFPRFKIQLKEAGLTSAEIARTLKNLGPEGLKPGIVKTRTGNILKIGYQEDIFKVLPFYQDLAAKSAFKLPAYAEARVAMKRMEKGNLQDLASWYIDNYIGHPRLRSEGRDAYKKVAGWIGQIYYRSFLGLNIDAAAINATQIINTFTDMGLDAVKGLGRISTRAGRKEFHDSGILADMVVFESAAISNGIDKVLYAPFQLAEYLLRGSAYLGAKTRAARTGITGEAAELFARKTVGKTQFFYDASSPIRALDAVGAPGSIFMSFTFREGDFLVRNMAGGLRGVKAIAKGSATAADKQAVARMTRMIGVWSAIIYASGEGAQRMLQFWTTNAALPMQHATALVRWGTRLVFNEKREIRADHTVESIKDIPQDAIRALLELTPGRKVLKDPLEAFLGELGLPKEEE